MVSIYSTNTANTHEDSMIDVSCLSVLRSDSKVKYITSLKRGNMGIRGGIH